jgi:hypothetical protein
VDNFFNAKAQGRKDAKEDKKTHGIAFIKLNSRQLSMQLVMFLNFAPLRLCAFALKFPCFNAKAQRREDAKGDKNGTELYPSDPISGAFC